MKYKIKELAFRKGMHGIVSQVAKACNVTPVTASHWVNLKEDDERSIPSDHLRTIAAILETSMEDLYYDNQKIPA